VSSKSAEFNKYAETDDEDYDDVFFAKTSGSSGCPQCTLAPLMFIPRQRHHHSSSQHDFRANRGSVYSRILGHFLGPT
jgi:hypothetical protein